jgi:hypothetical protein
MTSFPRPNSRNGEPGGGVMVGLSPVPLLTAQCAPHSEQHVLRQPDLINDLPLLGVANPGRVEPIGLVG